MSVVMEGGTVFGFPKYPPFVFGEPRFPQDSFIGRYLHFLDVVDPSTLFTSQKRLEESRRLLEQYKEGDRAHSDKELWQAQKIKQAIIHPDTGERIFEPFRMSGYVPFGWITVTGILLPNPSWATMLFWQWMNQSHNACVNYANRNASQPQPLSTYARAYAIAVSAAISVSGGLTWILRSSKMDAARRAFLSRFIPLPATSLASSLNVIAMRSSELKTGIEVFDSDGKVIGVSKAAAKKALFETTVTRAFLPVPLLLLPPCILPFLERIPSLVRTPIRHLLLQAGVCTISFGASLPVALALFPQRSSISADAVEKEIRTRTTQPILFFNKGL